jgi:phosphatidylglycerophosphate synthase
LLSLSWVTDFFDGRLARRGGGGRLGDFDLPADATVGAGMLVGLVGGGHVWPWLVVPSVLLVSAYLVRYNPSFAMAFLGIVYAAVLWWLRENAAWGIGVVLGTIAVIAVLDWGRFVKLILPTFFGGLRPSRLAARFSLERE